MRLLLDENVPRTLKGLLDGHEVTTVQECGWAGIQNGELVEKADGAFDALITADRQLRYQQNLKNRRLAIVELPTNNRRLLKMQRDDILAALLEVAQRGLLYVVVSARVSWSSDRLGSSLTPPQKIGSGHDPNPWLRLT
ncbi:MAG: DUF5615 family PIN-like protein [Polyangiaceae bacterium]|nr:DUF5615 family PIN-like protein [Polyangiaceae bacterium]